MKNILIFWIIMISISRQMYAQLSNVQMVLSTQDSSIETVYGMVYLKVRPVGLDDSTKMLLFKKTNFIWVKFPGMDWLKYPERMGYNSTPNYYIPWSNQGYINYTIDLSYFYFSNPGLVDTFMPVGGDIQVKFTGKFSNMTKDSTYYWTSNILAFNIPAAVNSDEEVGGFKYLLSQEKTFSGTHLEDIFFPEIDLSTFSSEKHYKYLIEHFPNTLVGAMAKCRLAILFCAYHSHLTTIPPAIKEQINQFYQTLKAHPSKYIRRQAEVLIKCHD